MTEQATEFDPRTAGKILAIQRLQRYGIDHDEEQLMKSDVVDAAIEEALKHLDGDEPPQYVEYLAETVAFAAMAREISGDRNIGQELLMRIKDVLREVFDGLIYR